MDINKFIEKYKNTEIQNKYLKTIIMILVLAIIIEGFLVVYVSNKNRTVLVPAFIDRQFYVQGNDASTEYIEMMTKYAIELISNYTPETIESRMAEFMRFINIEYYQKVSSELKATIVNDAVKYSISQFYVVSKIYKQGNNIEVSGVMRQFAQDKLIHYGPMSYKIKYKINNGRYEIEHFELVKQNR